MRKELSQLVEIQRDNRKAMNKNKAKLFKKYNIDMKEGLAQLIEELKQKISAKMQRLARYKKRGPIISQQIVQKRLQKIL